MPETFDFGKALQQMRDGMQVARVSSWPDAYGCYRSHLLIKGREIAASFGPMVQALGEGTPFFVQDHIDAIFKYPEGDLRYGNVVGFNFSQDDILATDWMLVS